MNASDIVRAKQSRVIYQAYKNPTVYQSSVYSTIRPISSILGYVSSGVLIGSTSYTSCVNTLYTYVTQPTFLSYESAYLMKQGPFECGEKCHSDQQWKNTMSSLVYTYSSIYSSLSTPSSIRVTSTLVASGATPVICPLISFYQGNACTTCNGACCPNCSG